MKLNNNRGFAWVPILLLAAAAAWLAPHFHLPAFLQKGPPTKQLAQAQDDLTKAKQAQKAAEDQLQTALAKEAAQTHAQLAYSQQMNAGAASALARVPAEHQVPEVKLAAEMVARTQAGLAAAIGNLPEAQQAEITKLVGDALSGLTTERDAALKALADKDADLQATKTAKAKVEATLPGLKAAVATSQAAVAAKDAIVQTKTKEVSLYADQKDAADRKAGSLEGYVGQLWHLIIIAGLIYLVVHFALPSLAQEFPASAALTRLNKTTKSIFSAHM